MQSISLDFDTSFNESFNNNYKLQNVAEKRAIENLKNSKNGSWIFRFDYITQKYYLTIKYNDDEYINHHILYYNRKTDEVIIKNNKIQLKEYLIELKKIYKFYLEKEIIV